MSDKFIGLALRYIYTPAGNVSSILGLLCLE